MNPLMGKFFDTLGDGITLLNSRGVVTYANGSGVRLFKVIPGKPFPDPRVLRALDDVVKGVAESPNRVALGEGPLDITRIAHIAQLPIPDTYAVSLQDQEQKAFYEMTLTNFHEFVALELAKPIQRFGRDMEDYLTKSEGKETAAELTQMVDDAKILGARFGRIRLMAELFRSAPLVAQERLQFGAMVEDALNAESDTIAKRELAVYLDGFKSELPPMYGSRPWLTQAFRELISNAARYAAAKSKIEIKLACTGAHVVLTFRNFGQFASPKLQSRFLFVPFQQVAQLIKEKRMPSKAIVGKPQPADAVHGPGIGLAICQQIVQLHGGHLRVTEGNEDNMIEFAMELATGAPARDTSQLDIAQAQRYAHDMAALMSTMRQRKATPA